MDGRFHSSDLNINIMYNVLFFEATNRRKIEGEEFVWFNSILRCFERKFWLKNLKKPVYLFVK